MIHFRHHLQFFTSTNLNWLCILHNDYHKQIVIEALQNRVERNMVTVYGFVIMPNHFHCIWRIHDQLSREDFQRDFLKFTARSILAFMRMHDDKLLACLQVKAADRQNQVWERNSLSIDLFSESMFLQKLNYIHQNPLQPKWQLSTLPELYLYSSASFYESGDDPFKFLCHYKT